MSQYVVADLRQKIWTFAGGPLEESDVLVLEKLLGNEERPVDVAFESKISIAAKESVFGFVKSGFLVTHEALFYDPGYTSLVEALGMAPEEGGHKAYGGVPFQQLPEPWELTDDDDPLDTNLIDMGF